MTNKTEKNSKDITSSITQIIQIAPPDEQSVHQNLTNNPPLGCESTGEQIRTLAWQLYGPNVAHGPCRWEL